MCSLRISGPFLLTALLTATLSPQAHAQPPQSPQIPHGPSSQSTQTTAPASVPAPADSAEIASEKLPDAPGMRPSNQLAADQQTGGSIVGTVLDTEGAEVPNALVTL